MIYLTTKSGLTEVSYMLQVGNDWWQLHCKWQDSPTGLAATTDRLSVADDLRMW